MELEPKYKMQPCHKDSPDSIEVDCIRFEAKLFGGYKEYESKITLYKHRHYSAMQCPLGGFDTGVEKTNFYYYHYDKPNSKKYK